MDPNTAIMFYNVMERIACALEEQNRYTADFETRSKERHALEMDYHKGDTVIA